MRNEPQNESTFLQYSKLCSHSAFHSKDRESKFPCIKVEYQDVHLLYAQLTYQQTFSHCGYVIVYSLDTLLFYLHTTFPSLIPQLNRTMILSLSKTFVAALAVAAVHAYPQPRHTPVENEEFLESLTTAPTVIRKYRRVLTKNAEGQEIITGKYLAEATTLDFTKEENMMPVPGGQGGKTSMVSVYQWNRDLCSFPTDTLNTDWPRHVSHPPWDWHSNERCNDRPLWPSCTARPPSRQRVLPCHRRRSRLRVHA